MGSNWGQSKDSRPSNRRPYLKDTTHHWEPTSLFLASIAPEGVEKNKMNPSAAPGNQVKASAVILRMSKIEGRLDTVVATVETLNDGNKGMDNVKNELKELKKIVVGQGKTMSGIAEENKRLREEVTALTKCFEDKNAERSSGTSDDESADDGLEGLSDGE